MPRRNISEEPPPSPPDLAFERGLPANLDAERFTLGLVLLDESKYWDAVSVLPIEAFSLEKHRRIYARMRDIRERGETIDRVTVANELMRQGQLESVDGLAYLVSLDHGMPEISNLDSYIRIISEKHASRQLIFRAQQTIDRCLHGVDPVNEIAATLQEHIEDVKGGVSVKDDGGRNPEEVVTQFPGGISAFLDPTLQPKGLKTGFYRFDDMTEGFHGGELLILAARPSVGKTALMLNIATQISVVDENPGAIFSFEMNAATLLRRMMCADARVDSHKFRAGFMNQDERYRIQKSLSRITNSPLRIFDKSEIGITKTLSVIRYLVKKHGLKWAAIDYLQLMASREKSESRNIEVGKMTRSLKLLAGDCDIPLLVLSQLSRANEKRPGGSYVPILSDLRDSGSIEQDSDSVFFIHREELYRRDREDLKGLADLIVAKQRNGPVGVVPLRFLSQLTKFENRAEDFQEEFPQQ